MKTKVKENQKGENIKEMRKCKTLKNNHNGITLIALVITIIVLLILASVSIAMLTGDNGILTRAGDAKIETALGAVKEQVRLYQIEKKMNEQEVTAESLLAEGKVSRTVQAGEEDKYYMYYALKENSFEGMQGLGKGNIASLKDVFLIDDNLNVKYIASNGKEYGDNLNNKVLEDETEIRFSSKAFSEYVSKISGVTEDEMKFKWMKNQTKLEISDPNIDSLQDLIFFPNLKALRLENLTLNNLEGISNCIKLELYQTRNSDIKDNSELAKLINLKTYIDYNKTKEEDIKAIKDLNLIQLNLYNYNDYRTEVISNIKTLKNLHLQYTEIEKIDKIAKLTNLETLAIVISKIDSLKGIENMTKLRDISLNDNEIYDITELANNEGLKKIDVRHNSQINGDRNSYQGEALKRLNKLSEMVNNGCVIFLDVDKLKLFSNYKKLNLSSQGLTTLEALEGITEIEELTLSYNRITLEDQKSKEILSKMNKLKTLDFTRKSYSRYKTN